MINDDYDDWMMINDDWMMIYDAYGWLMMIHDSCEGLFIVSDSS